MECMIRNKYLIAYGIKENTMLYEKWNGVSCEIKQ